MSLRKKLISSAVAAFAVGAFSVAGTAQTTETPSVDGQKAEKREGRGFGKRGGKRDGMRHGGGRGMGFLRGIELTDAQKGQIRLIHEANKPSQEAIDQMKALRETRKSGGTITAEQKAQLKELRQAQRAKMQGVHEQVLAVLTVDQKAQLETRKAEMQKRREEFREKRQELRKDRKIEAKPADNN